MIYSLHSVGRYDVYDEQQNNDTTLNHNLNLNILMTIMNDDDIRKLHLHAMHSLQCECPKSSVCVKV